MVIYDELQMLLFTRVNQVDRAVCSGRFCHRSGDLEQISGTGPEPGTQCLYALQNNIVSCTGEAGSDRNLAFRPESVGGAEILLEFPLRNLKQEHNVYM